MPRILGLGAVFQDTVLTAPTLAVDGKVQATHRDVRLGGNILNTFAVLADAPPLPGSPSRLQLEFCGAVGSRESCLCAPPPPPRAGTPALTGRHRYAAKELETHGVTPRLVYRPAVHGLANAYVLCAQDRGSRTIISHLNGIAEPSAEELGCLLLPAATAAASPPVAAAAAEWIHVEGRNCESVVRFLRRMPDSGGGGAYGATRVSVDLEKSCRPGIDELARLADVLFVSSAFCRDLVGDHDLHLGAGGDKQAYAAKVLAALEGWIKPGASGHLLLGAAGSVCFFWRGSGGGGGGDGGGGGGDGSGGGGLEVVDCTAAAPGIPPAELVETVGAGDTFIAGVIWASLAGMSPPAANRLATELARKKCRQSGFGGLWGDSSDAV